MSTGTTLPEITVKHIDLDLEHANLYSTEGNASATLVDALCRLVFGSGRRRPRHTLFVISSNFVGDYGPHAASITIVLAGERFSDV